MNADRFQELADDGLLALGAFVTPMKILIRENEVQSLREDPRSEKIIATDKTNYFYKKIVIEISKTIDKPLIVL